MKKIIWDVEKAEILKNDVTRGSISFEDCVVAIEEGRVLDDIANPSEQHPHQRMLVLGINNYAYIVPYVETDDEIFLKTVFPSRKHTAIYLTEK
ncbi:MAG: toxin [Methylophaga sp.]|nr:MAG: toxin [Methylophaga sp.]